ncbi:orofacial cleft 1 candidate gene 1 protein homolog [Polyodon spathula]|uniref:orofacial cleft 1 candidate gene 1 protein homolog n=1 Tax=Polyodon spathula TaxID=7913 RepID=UPI001B7F65CC|nr:orofacial cleft 1 candidate gene 1 protein homolog [Polyodon spathula]
MDETGYDKFQQKALKQTKQKKSKSAEFLMGEEERAAAEGIENPAFNISKIDLSAYQASEGKEIKHDRQDSSLAAHQQKNGLQARAEPRGNERRQNYFDPPMDEKINPRQCGMEVSTEDELELRSVREDEREFYKKLSKFFEEEDTTVIDLPGMITEEVRAGPGVQKCSGVFPGIASLRQEVEDEVIPHYVEQFEKCVQGDMIAVGSLSLEQEIDLQGDLNQQKISILHDKLSVGFQSGESQLLKKHQGDVIANYGELTETKPRSDRMRGKKWKVEWSKRPQPVEILLWCLRGVKDKLPQGSVTLKVSLYNRLGGYALYWSKVKEQLWAGTTQPVQHNGNFYNLELQVNQSVYTVSTSCFT